jgi:hypothetical protein
MRRESLCYQVSICQKYPCFSVFSSSEISLPILTYTRLYKQNLFNHTLSKNLNLHLHFLAQRALNPNILVSDTMLLPACDAFIYTLMQYIRTPPPFRGYRFTCVLYDAYTLKGLTAGKRLMSGIGYSTIP